MRLWILAGLLIAVRAAASPIDSLTPLPTWEPFDREAGLPLTPHSICVDPIGRLWILDRARGRVAALDEKGEGRSFGIEGEGARTPPVADFGASGAYLYILDPTAPSITLLDLDGFYRERVDLSGEITRAGRGGFLASRMIVDRSGNLWLIDGPRGRVLRFDRRGHFLDAPLDARTGSDRPERIADAALGPQDELLLLDAAARRIVLLTPDGVPGPVQVLPDPIPEPASLAVDRQGNRYLVDKTGRLRIFDPRGRQIWGGLPPGDRPSGDHRSSVTSRSVLCRADPARGTILRWRIEHARPEDADR